MHGLIHACSNCLSRWLLCDTMLDVPQCLRMCGFISFCLHFVFFFMCVVFSALLRSDICYCYLMIFLSIKFVLKEWTSCSRVAKQMPEVKKGQGERHLKELYCGPDR